MSPDVSTPTEREWLEGLTYEDRYPGWPGSCGCSERCGDDGDIDGPGVCRGLPRQPEPPLVEIVLVPK